MLARITEHMNELLDPVKRRPLAANLLFCGIISLFAAVNAAALASEPLFRLTNELLDPVILKGHQAHKRLATPSQREAVDGACVLEPLKARAKGRCDRVGHRIIDCAV